MSGLELVRSNFPERRSTPEVSKLFMSSSSVSVAIDLPVLAQWMLVTCCVQMTTMHSDIFFFGFLQSPSKSVGSGSLTSGFPVKPGTCNRSPDAWPGFSCFLS